jgi:hypothetical protein
MILLLDAMIAREAGGTVRDSPDLPPTGSDASSDIA